MLSVSHQLLASHIGHQQAKVSQQLLASSLVNNKTISSQCSAGGGKC